MSSNPIPGSFYTVAPGDTLTKISKKAYGSGEWYKRIFRANITGLKSGDPDLIFPGEKLLIPVIPELKKDLIISPAQLDDETISLSIEGRVIPLDNCTINCSIANIADGFNASIKWTPGEDPELDQILKPFGYPNFVLYVGRQRRLSGIIYGIGSGIDSSGQYKEISGASYTADMVDSTMRPPYEFNNLSLQQIANEVIKPLGINVVFNDEDGGAFDRVTAESNETYFDFFKRLASQRGLLITSDEFGNCVFTKAKTDQAPVLSILEGEAPAGLFESTFDGRKRFAIYKSNSDTPGADGRSSAAIDENVPRSRFKTFDSNETTSGNLGTSAEWERSRQIAQSLNLVIPWKGWYYKNNLIWKENLIVNVKSESISIPNGFNFLTKSIQYISNSNGNSAQISIVPPQVYTGEEIKDPWGI